MIDLYRRNWYRVALWAFIALAFAMGFWGRDISTLRVILIYSLMALLAHQTEEYLLVGGAAVVINAGLYGEDTDYDHYPGNTNSGMIVNLLSYPFYVAAIVWPGAIWLGLATMFFGFTQVLGHGIEMNIKTKGWYNPGLITAVFLHLPIGIYYIWYITTHNLGSGWDYLWGVLALIAAYALIVILPVQGLKDRNSPYRMSEEELARFHMVDKLVARGVIKPHQPDSVH